MSKEKICIGCKKKFYSADKRQKYCNRKCYLKYRKIWNKGKKCPSISRAAKNRPMLVAGWNKGLPSEMQPRWKGGISRVYYTYQARRTLEKKYGIKWEEMNKPYKAVIHHIDKNYKNNKFENLCVMSASDHSKLHIEEGDSGWRIYNEKIRNRKL